MPLGPEAGRWNTAAVERAVLLVVHNVTSAVRLLDVLPVFDDDERLQLVYTCTGSSPFLDGVEALFDDLGVAALPWDVAVSTRFDLALSASYGGELNALNAPLITIPHGMGYNKYLEIAGANGRTAERPNG